MKRIFLFIVVILLVWCSSADAVILMQGEAFQLVGAQDQIQIKGIGNQIMSNNGMVAQNQGQNAFGVQQQEDQTAILAQSGSQFGKHGILNQNQDGAITGEQGQIAEVEKPKPPCKPKPKPPAPSDPAQGESLTLVLSQGQTRICGVGTQVIGQGGVSSQSQIQFTPTTFQAEGQFVGGAQYAAQSGFGGVQNQDQIVIVNAGQGQSIN